MNIGFIEALSPILLLLVFNAAFLAVLAVAVVLLTRGKQAALAVLKRNFLGYFSNPTGYVFLCLFVLLTSVAAFWPADFFAANMATLDQLNRWFPIIMLFFIPAITMSIWADEKRQGTDELLLTLPADDFDIVIGKFLAALSIYTASLLFSQISTFFVLYGLTLAGLDVGLFFANYVGYWCIGLAMLAIGMVASFMTSNLTVGFILGAMFNAPLAFASRVDAIAPTRELARSIARFSTDRQFEDFGRGVLSLASVSFFVLVATLGVYLCMVLIGRRHWVGGKESNPLLAQYLLRTLCLIGIVVGGTMLFRNNDRRWDATEGKVSSLSSTTVQMLREIESDRPIVVEAFLSSDVPEDYARVKYELVNILREFEAIARRSKLSLDLRINDNLSVTSDEAVNAAKQYGITPRMVQTFERGAIKDQEILLGAAFRSGLEKVVVPFFETGIPIEYELVRSLNTVSRPTRKRLGVVNTEARMMGGFSFAGGMPERTERQAIIEELSKQYEVSEVDCGTPVPRDLYDVLMVVQPSSLGPEELTNLVEAVQSGIPTAIFEDPLPQFYNMPGTGDPKQSPGGMFGGGGQEPKGDIRALWDALGISIQGEPSMSGGVSPDIAWHSYNPYPQIAFSAATDQWVFVREEADFGMDNFSPDSDISRGLRELLFFYGGAIDIKADTPNRIVELVRTGPNAGRISSRRLLEVLRGNQRQMRVESLTAIQGPPTGPQTLAVYVEGPDPAGQEAGQDESAATKSPIRAVYVADADFLHSVFFDLRNRPESIQQVRFRLQNVTFALNAIDILAGEQDYPAIRRHEPQFSTLRLVEAKTEVFREQEAVKRRDYQQAYDAAVQEIEDQNSQQISELEARVRRLQQEGATSVAKQRELVEAIQSFQQRSENLNRRLEVERIKLEQQRDANIREAQREADNEKRSIQNYYKMLAVFIPPIPPLVVGVVVFVSRRLREREGISKTRLR